MEQMQSRGAEGAAAPDDALIAHRLTSPNVATTVDTDKISFERLARSYRTSPYRMMFIPLSVSLWNDLADRVFDGVRLAGFMSRANIFFSRLNCSLHFCLLRFFLSLLSFYRLVLWGWGLWTDRVSIILSRPCVADIS